MIESNRLDVDYRLLCEKIINESWSKVERHMDQISEALDKEILTNKDISLLKMAARAFIQKALLEKADNEFLFGMDLYDVSPCGTRLKKDCPCSRKICLLVEDLN